MSRAYPAKLYTDESRQEVYGQRTLRADGPSDAAVMYAQIFDSGDYSLQRGDAVWVEVEDGGHLRLFKVSGLPQPTYQAEELAAPRAAGGAP